MDVEPRSRRQSVSSNFGQRPARRPWPARARRLIEEAGTLCTGWLDTPLRRCLDTFDQNLYQLAERSRNHLEQQRLFDSRALLEKHRTTFAERLLDELRERFARMGEPDVAATDATQPPSLSLLDCNEHELLAALDKLAARGEAQNSLLLSELSYRFAVLIAAPPLEGTALPPGPASLAQALRVASDPFDLPVEHRLLLLQAFEHTVIAALGALYETLNAHLLDDGILPHLRAFATVRPPALPRAGSGPSLPQNAPAPQATEPDQADARASAARNDEPITVLETLRDLLARNRSDTAAPVSGRSATSDELQAALTALQQHLVQVADKAGRELRSAQRLREELLLQLNADRPAGASRMQLTPEQDDTVELVTMLFEQLGQQLSHGPHARALLGGLQLPMLRLAVTDHDFFDQHEHPGRRLLGTVAQAANDWLDGADGEVDRPLLAQLEQLVERARQEPPSAGLYTALLADIEHHLAQLSRKAKATERRHIEAAQGREKLDQARRRAAELMDERFARAQPRGLLRALLERAWSDVLALTLLRHGEDSEFFRGRLAITDQLLGLATAGDPELLQREVENGLQQIGMHAEEAEQVALRLIGTGIPAPTATPPSPGSMPNIRVAAPSPTTTPPAADAVPTATPAASPSTAKTVSKTRAGTPPITASATESATARSTPPVASDNLPSATDLAVRLKQRPRLGEQRDQEGKRPTAPAIEEEAPLGPQEARIYNRLRQLPYGTWFEFTDPASGQTTALKLAWFSPVTGNSLFVTRRGQRGEELNLRELARAMASGRVREMAQQRENLLDRAWRSLTSNLLRPSRSGGQP